MTKRNIFLYSSIIVSALGMGTVYEPCEYENDRQQTFIKVNPVEDNVIIEATCSDDTSGEAAL